MARQQTAARKKRFLQAIERQAKVATAADLAGVDRSLPYKWAETDPKFNQAWDLARTRRIPQVRDLAFEEAMEGDTKMQRYLLDKYDTEAPVANEVDTIRIIIPEEGEPDERAQFFS